jgi:alpha-1,6-mannosyltransferase
MQAMEAVDRQHPENEGVRDQDGGFEGKHAAALILLAGAVLLAPRFFVAAYAAAAVAWLVLRNASLRLRWVLLIAIALRLPLFFSDPQLSGDVYRYLWDGKVLAHGINPYLYPPNDARLASLREPWHGRINHPELRTIYPPHAQLLFALVHRLEWWRLLIVCGDLAAIVLLRRHGLAYATFPLLLFEGTWSGHIDALAAALLATSSGIATGLAIGLKIIPIAALPALVARHRMRFAIAAAATLAVPFLPFARGPLMPGFRDYATRWIFNSPLYDVVFAIVSRIPTKELWTHHPLRFATISDVVYRHVHPEFVTRAVMATFAVAGIALAGRSVTRALAALLLCSPAIHPWYWLALLPSALVERSSFLLVALCAPFSYLLYAGAPKLLVYALCYVTLFLPSARATSAGGSPLAALRFRRARGTSPS